MFVGYLSIYQPSRNDWGVSDSGVVLQFLRLRWKCCRLWNGMRGSCELLRGDWYISLMHIKVHVILYPAAADHIVNQDVHPDMLYICFVTLFQLLTFLSFFFFFNIIKDNFLENLLNFTKVVANIHDLYK